MPLFRRVPKFGFKNINRVEYRGVNIGDLQVLVDTQNVSDIDIQVLIDNGLAGKRDRVKILGAGELTAKVNVSAHAFTKTAKEAIENQGGTATCI
ncbi:MAG: 50S ribosomal protein L15 [Bacteroidia bacterium]|nr:MAG: 50S ribosomal protein L15 [Bacteroidia bacterium]